MRRKRNFESTCLFALQTAEVVQGRHTNPYQFFLLVAKTLAPENGRWKSTDLFSMEMLLETVAGLPWLIRYPGVMHDSDLALRAVSEIG
jgi:hypothetical protein